MNDMLKTTTKMPKK